MSQTIDGSPWGDHGDHLFAGTATRHGAVAEGPFLLPQPGGTQYAVASETRSALDLWRSRRRNSPNMKAQWAPKACAAKNTKNTMWQHRVPLS